MLWAGSLTHNGYAHIIIKRGDRWTTTVLHRELYLVEVGDIPAGLVLDHLCRNRSCINTAHLEPVTNAVNVQRGMIALGKQRNRYGLSDKKYCIRGHERNKSNTYIKPDGTKCCKACRRKSGEVS